MASSFESRKMLAMAMPLVELARHLVPLFPHMEWDLKRSGFTIDSTQYLSVALYFTIAVFTMCTIATVLPFAAKGGIEDSYSTILFSVIISFFIFGYMLLLPSTKMKARATLIDRDLEYMLKDMYIQLSSGVPLFDTLVNIARGEYGECTKICEGIIQEVEQGKSMTDVLDDVGMWSPSEYFRKSLWQLVNALKSGSDVANALEVMSNDIRMEKENKIKSYGKELNLYGLIYMMGCVIVPSMGVTLLVILSSFIGGEAINETLFWIIMLGLIIFQFVFITYVKNKRPTI
jgi:pilus assembly protein TadC